MDKPQVTRSIIFTGNGTRGQIGREVTGTWTIAELLGLARSIEELANQTVVNFDPTAPQPNGHGAKEEKVIEQ